MEGLNRHWARPGLGWLGLDGAGLDWASRLRLARAGLGWLS